MDTNLPPVYQPEDSPQIEPFTSQPPVSDIPPASITTSQATHFHGRPEYMNSQQQPPYPDHVDSTTLTQPDMVKAELPTAPKNPLFWTIPLIVVLLFIIAGGAAYIVLLPKNVEPPVQAVVVQQEEKADLNIFEDELTAQDEENPFETVSTAESTVETPFLDTKSSNPFDQFEQTTSPVTQTEEYQNPF